MDTATDHLPRVLELKYGPVERQGWRPRMQRAFGYANPDDIYEATLFGLVDEQTDWLDVGCGWRIFPSNHPGAEVLAGRARHLVGLDPSEHVERNPLLHERARGMLEDYRTDRMFDLITLRMVAEHIAAPQAAVAALSRLTKPGGRVVIYTVSRWSPVTILSHMTPLKFHQAVKRRLWGVEDEDTFPTAYRMNTRRVLRSLFEKARFKEESFAVLDDCRTLQNWRPSLFIELSFWKILQAMGLHYPERCLLGIYRKDA